MRGPMPAPRSRPSGSGLVGVRPAGRSCPGAALPARRSRSRRLAGGGGPGCGGLGSPAALVRASGAAWPIGAGSPPVAAGRPAPQGPPLRRRRARSPAASARRGLGPRAGWSWRPVSGLLVRLAGGGPVSLPPSAAPCPSRPGSPLAAPCRAARLRHGRPPLLPPPGRCAAASGRPGQSPRPGGVGVGAGPAWVLLRPWWALLPCCVAAGG